MAQEIRRNLLKGLAISAPAAWATPFVKSVILPAHAQTSCVPTLSCSTNNPTNGAPIGVSLCGGGTAWGWCNSSGAGQDYYLANICGLKAQACPGTKVTIEITNTEVASYNTTSSPTGSASVGHGSNPLTVQANTSGVASFSECVTAQFPGGEGGILHFTLRFTSDDGSGPCDIPFCFTEGDPSVYCNA